MVAELAELAELVELGLARLRLARLAAQPVYRGLSMDPAELKCARAESLSQTENASDAACPAAVMRENNIQCMICDAAPEPRPRRGDNL